MIDAAAMSSEVKAYNLGLVLMTYVGSAVLRGAIQALGPVLQGPPADDPPILARAPTVGLGDLVPLIEICLALDPVKRDSDPLKLRTTWLSLDPSLTRSPDKVLVVLARLRRHFGPDTLATALTYLAAGRADVTRATGETVTADKFTA